MIIKVDTREIVPLEFKVEGSVSKIVKEGLPFGDYWAEWEPGSEAAGYSCEMPLAFERKGIGDLFGTLTGGMERFKRELQRAKDNKFLGLK